MKRIAKHTLALALQTLVFSACQSTKEEPLYYEDGIVNLDGPWAPEQIAYASDKPQLAVKASLKQD